jgi:hypothetical protein
MTNEHTETRERREERRESDDFHLRVLIETMSRDGHTEREIVAAVNRAGGRRAGAET